MHDSQKIKVAQIKNKKESLLDKSGEISLTAILNAEPCQSIFSACIFRDRIYTPVKTVFMFIKQVLSTDKSCKNAVAQLIAEQAVMDEPLMSENTGPYVKARQRLPEAVVKLLVKEVSKIEAKLTPIDWKPYGRELKSFDGTMLKMADTLENRAIFSQHKNQAEGAGFPMTRLVVVMSLTLGTVLDYELDAHKGKGSGESSLLRRMMGSIEKDDIVLGDRYFPNFFLMADLNNIEADGIFRAQSQRHYDFRTGERLGKNDHLVFWTKPAKPGWMEQNSYDAYPDKLQIREFKSGGNIYVTTLLDEKKYPKKELAKIYKRRWEIELNLRSIKSIMNMDMLVCKTPEMVKKEIGIHFLAYNFIRIIMAEACVKHHTLPWTISFKGTVQLIFAFMPHFLNSTEKNNKILYATMLSLIVKNKVGNRPGRVEPRVIKQRRKAFPLLSKPRKIEKERMERKINKMILRNAET